MVLNILVQHLWHFVLPDIKTSEINWRWFIGDISDFILLLISFFLFMVICFRAQISLFYDCFFFFFFFFFLSS
jgi:hypothetical protein